MKYRLLLITLILSTLPVFANDIDDAFDEIDSFIAQGKYLTAINKVNEIENKYSDPRIILYRVKVSIEGFATSMNHRMFAFKDLEPGEDIYEVRAGEGSFTMVMGDLQETINEYLSLYPDNAYVNEAAGDYYNDLKHRYGDQLEYSYEDLYGMVVKYYLKAYEEGVESLKIVSEIGENSLYLGDLDQGIRFYKMAVSIEPNEPSYNYNLGYALFRTSDYKQASEHLQIAATKYEEPDLKSDAYGLMGDCSQNLGNLSEAEKYYRTSADIYPQNYYTQSGLLKLLFKTEKGDEADRLIQGMLLSNIKSFDALSELIRTYVQAGRTGKLETKMKELVQETEGTIDEATIRFYLAQLESMNGKDPKEDFKKAKEIYSEYLPADHGILSYIDSLLEGN